MLQISYGVSARSQYNEIMGILRRSDRLFKLIKSHYFSFVELDRKQIVFLLIF